MQSALYIVCSLFALSPDISLFEMPQKSRSCDRAEAADVISCLMGQPLTANCSPYSGHLPIRTARESRSTRLVDINDIAWNTYALYIGLWMCLLICITCLHFRILNFTLNYSKKKGDRPQRWARSINGQSRRRLRPNEYVASLSLLCCPVLEAINRKECGTRHGLRLVFWWA